MTELKIGNRPVSYEQAEKWIRTYTSEPEDPKKPFAYPWYDAYDTGASIDLCDADFLAPVLLNARPTIAAYASMWNLKDTLNAALKEIPREAVLDENTPIDLIEMIGPLYACLDEKMSYGIRGTTLSKALHRKRPAFIPLYDEHIRRCYRTQRNGEAPRIPRSKDRSWSDFMVLLTREILKDIVSQATLWNSLTAAVCGTTELTRLRCFDIVAWRLGAAK